MNSFCLTKKEKKKKKQLELFEIIIKLLETIQVKFY